ncbi:hypothetical protein [Ruminococcus sp. FC2018]|uniref:hypothetical protein n=1 Tax=Ruminococcus sp. FC2018 TaxID=1410617 RepID=UPI00048C7088|nr:hypothetical protein [Ruminococcus sp. FC2018]
MTNTTKKTNGKIKRTLTAALAAIMMMSTAATFAASAADTQAVVNMNTSTAITMAERSGAIVEVDDDLLAVKDVTSGTLFKILEETTEYGKFFTPALSGMLDLFIGGQPDPTQEKLDQINDKIDKLFDRIDKLQNDLVSTMETDLGIQSFHNVYTEFKSQTKTMRRKIEDISKDKSLTKLDKIAKIGSLAGAYSEWDIKFENVLGQLNELFENPSATANANIFDLTYRHFCGQVMFSGEAIDKAKPLCDALMQAYIAGCTTITECLSAQLYISQLPKEMQDQVDSGFKPHICLNKTDIENEIKDVNKNIAKNGKIITTTVREIVGFKGDNGKDYPVNCGYQYGSPDIFVNEMYYIPLFLGAYIELYPKYADREVTKTVYDNPYQEMYNKVFNTHRNILVNKNPKGEGYQVNDKANYKNHGDNPNCDGKYWSNMSKLTQKFYNNAISGMKIKFDDVKALAKYCSDKGISIRSLLNNVGIDTTAVPENANLVTSNAIDDSTNAAHDIFTQCYYQKTFYKGVNIDRVGAGEQKYQLLDCGWNLWKGGQEWNYAPGGSFCWI